MPDSFYPVVPVDYIHDETIRISTWMEWHGRQVDAYALVPRWEAENAVRYARFDRDEWFRTVCERAFKQGTPPARADLIEAAAAALVFHPDLVMLAHDKTATMYHTPTEAATR